MNKKILSLLALGVLFAGCTCKKPVSVVDIPAPGSVQDFVSCVGDRVYFEYDRPRAHHVDKLSPEAMDIICKQAAWLKQYDYNIEIVGHCDERGTQEYNLALGTRRADAVAKYLVQQGVSKDRITISSVGKDHPICEGHSEAAFAKNRCGIVLLKKGESYVAEPADKKEIVTLEKQS